MIEVPLTRRKYDKLASYLLFLAFGLSVVFNYFLKEGYFAESSNWKGYVVLWVCTPLVLLLYYFIGKGRVGAKTVFLVLYGVVMATSLINYQHNIDDQLTTPLKAMNYVSQNFLQISACILMLLGPSSSQSN